MGRLAGAALTQGKPLVIGHRAFCVKSSEWPEFGSDQKFFPPAAVWWSAGHEILHLSPIPITPSPTQQAWMGHNDCTPFLSLWQIPPAQAGVRLVGGGEEALVSVFAAPGLVLTGWLHDMFQGHVSVRHASVSL